VTNGQSPTLSPCTVSPILGCLVSQNVLVSEERADPISRGGLRGRLQKVLFLTGGKATMSLPLPSHWLALSYFLNLCMNREGGD